MPAPRLHSRRRQEDRSRHQENFHFVLPLDAAAKQVGCNDAAGQNRAREQKRDGAKIEKKIDKAAKRRPLRRSAGHCAKGSAISQNGSGPRLLVHQATDLALSRSAAASADFEAKSFQALSSAIARHFAMSSAEKSTTVAPFAA